jgi:hypothetical protein
LIADSRQFRLGDHRLGWDSQEVDAYFVGKVEAAKGAFVKPADERLAGESYGLEHASREDDSAVVAATDAVAGDQGAASAIAHRAARRRS